jgi:hypothetical protein
MSSTGFLNDLLEILPRAYLNEVAERFCNVSDPMPKVRSSLKTRILAADTPALRKELATWVATQLNVESLDLR